MDIKNVLAVIQSLLTIIAITGGLVLSRIYFRQLSPVINYHLTPEWLQDGISVVIKLEIENKSKAILNLDHRKECSFRLQVLRHSLSKIDSLSDWVAFTEDNIKADEMPLEWKNPVKILTSNIYPGEIVEIERLYKCSIDELLHIGIQIVAEHSKTTQFLAGYPNSNESWTRTFIVARKEK